MKQSKTHRAAALLLAAACMMLFGCGRAAEVLYDPTADTAETDTTAALSSADTEDTATESDQTEPAVTEPLSYLQAQQEKEYAYARENGFKLGESGALCFRDPASDSNEPIEHNEYNLPLQDGTLELDLNVLVSSMDDIDCDVTGTFVFGWNGQLYDFSLDGRQSTDGMLQLELRYWEEITVPFRAENLPVQEGENTMFFWFFPYCEETGYPMHQCFTGYYLAEEAREGRAPVTVTAEADLDPARIAAEADEIKATYTSDFDKDALISYDNGRDYTLHENPTFYVNLCNFNHEEGASNRSGIAMFFVDGNLMPVWNDTYYAAVFATDADYRKTYAVKTDFQAGEQHDMLTVYAEMQDDKNMDGFFFSQGMECRCNIE